MVIGVFIPGGSPWQLKLYTYLFLEEVLFIKYVFKERIH